MNRKFNLLNLPPELQSMIAGALDDMSLYSFRLVAKGLDTWTKHAPKLSVAEWKTLQSRLESRRPRGDLLSLACTGCQQVLAKNCFSDAQVRKTVGRGRLCVGCVTKRCSGKPKTFTIDGIEHFGCQGCRKAKLLHEEDKCEENGALWGDFLPHSYISRHISSHGSRWCQQCWTAVRNYHWLSNTP